ncbi:Chain length determinant protein [Methylobacterium phyllostachyos]|uniref:Chain length determinant protein n=1 Tax=Methylobacterium phyllostachyos TaxID=582672 RepID=A0A1H0I4Y5_9HYPH|nr:Wzz/FepE/Etk N-terminal domain-containing protein [Methylobacterium phyllostachyos]SDO26508.1 Chain length determinant protein [Methylobacterium phyllostachyos]
MNQHDLNFATKRVANNDGKIAPQKIVPPHEQSGAILNLKLSDLRNSIQRNRRWIFWWSLAAAFSAIFYLSLAADIYVATASLTLEPRRQVGSASDASANQPVMLDSAQADSQLQVIRSEILLRAVFNKLKPEDVQLLSLNHGILSTASRKIFGLFRGSTPAHTSPDQEKSSEVKREIAFQRFMQRVNARRIGLSYVIEISSYAETPELAARLSNAVVMQYIYEQIAAKAAAAQGGSEYLQVRIERLKSELNAAERAVIDGTVPTMFFPDADARVIGSAVAPLGRSYPQPILVIIYAAILGPIGAIIASTIWHQLSEAIKGADDLERISRVECIATVQASDPTGRSKLRGRPHRDAIGDIDTYLRFISRHRRSTAIGFVSYNKPRIGSRLLRDVAQHISNGGGHVIVVDACSFVTRGQAAQTSSSDSSMYPLAKTSMESESPAEQYVRIYCYSPGKSYDLCEPLDNVLTNLRNTEHAGPLVLIDLPDLRTSKAARTLFDYIDGAILVAETGRLLPDQYQFCLNLIRSSNADIISTILVDVEG